MIIQVFQEICIQGYRQWGAAIGGADARFQNGPADLDSSVVFNGEFTFPIGFLDGVFNSVNSRKTNLHER